MISIIIKGLVIHGCKSLKILEREKLNFLPKIVKSKYSFNKLERYVESWFGPHVNEDFWVFADF